MDRFAIVDTYYWWLAEHHEGQGSKSYARLSRLSCYYRPGAAANKPADPDGYMTLCQRHGCEHFAADEAET
jgi:hypothetical protein